MDLAPCPRTAPQHVPAPFLSHYPYTMSSVPVVASIIYGTPDNMQKIVQQVRQSKACADSILDQLARSPRCSHYYNQNFTPHNTLTHTHSSSSWSTRRRTRRTC